MGTEGEAGTARDGSWIAYSIDRLMPANVYILGGSLHMWDSHTRLKGVPFYLLIPGGRAPSESLTGKDKAREVVFLYRFSARQALEQIRITDVSMPMDLENRPLFWLGKTSPSESFQLLQRLYGGTQDDFPCSSCPPW